MAEAWIHGKSAALEAAIAKAASLLSASRLPVIAGLGTDVAGARAAIKLAQSVGGVVDHMHSDGLLRDLDVMREAGMMVTTPNETRVHADFLLLVGPGLIEAWPSLPARLFANRRIVWLCPDAGARPENTPENMVVVGDDPFELPVVLAALRARCAGRPVAHPPLPLATIDSLMAELKKVRFGVAIWSAARHDSPTIEMLCGLVDDLNNGTRFSGLPLAASANAARPPTWKRKPTLVALTAAPDLPEADVMIAVGRPGIDHDAVEHLRATATLSAVSASKPSNAISVSSVLGSIRTALPTARPC